ncbi:RagB/SusD family nutrient uptake outer membrane protein [uncultured Mediterranea sp.]|uniref:RagB/SusD family nutrient uptake outer membrane protein n=1 Tax=uncultured Mediterranea sp. TaxID=1926662 RepID=UPI0027D99A11|nr:RagB/SusD family nutrient uptake outer membrane protein [uncultured Mediterranea sp.]
MKSILKYVVVAGLCLGSVSCADYLDIVPDDIATIEKCFNTRAAAEKFFFTCYTYLPNPTDVWSTPELMTSDEMWWNIDKPEYKNRPVVNLSTGLQNANDPYLNYWDGLNNGKNLFIAIRDCNIFLENIGRVPDLDDYERERWMAEVKFLKAYYHYFLMTLYGPVPIIDVNLPVSATPEEVRVYREPVDDVVNYIVSLIDDAIPNLPLEITDMTNEAGRITQAIAVALKAKALVWAASPLFNGNPDYQYFTDNKGRHLVDTEFKVEKWQRAAIALKNAIDTCELAGHGLYYYQKTTNMSDITAQKLTIRGAFTEEWNKEVVWGSTRDAGLQRLCMPRLVVNNLGNATNELGLTLKIAEQFYTDNGIPIDEDPTWDYDNRYQTQQITAEDKLNMEVGQVTAKLHFKREPRFYATVGFDRGALEGAGKLQDNDLYYIHARQGEPAGYRSVGEHNPTGYFNKKVIHPETSVGTASNTYNAVRYAFPIIRMSDLYLMYAEALNEANPQPTDEVYEYVDKVRARAGLKGVIESWQKSTIPGKPTTQDGMREIIRHERLNELAGEGQRFYDLRRWKEALEYLNQPVQGWNYQGATAEAFYYVVTYETRRFTMKDYLWPIKTNSITINKNLVQNPGW